MHQFQVGEMCTILAFTSRSRSVSLSQSDQCVCVCMCLCVYPNALTPLPRCTDKSRGPPGEPCCRQTVRTNYSAHPALHVCCDMLCTRGDRSTTCAAPNCQIFTRGGDQRKCVAELGVYKYTHSRAENSRGTVKTESSSGARALTCYAQCSAVSRYVVRAVCVCTDLIHNSVIRDVMSNDTESFALSLYLQSSQLYRFTQR